MAQKTIKAHMKQRRDTKANWASINPVLLDGELGIVSDDPNLYKVGDGTTAWNSLPFRGFDGTLVHEAGNSETTVMSQKAVTDALKTKANVYGKYPQLTAGFANNLVGRGEAVEAEFSFRASGGKSIEDGVARVKELRGNTIVENGELLSCKADAIKTVGFNAWDEQWEQGYINDQGIDGPASSEIRSRNYIRVLPSTAYYFPYYLGDTYGQSGSNFFRVLFYDKDKNVISATTTYTNWGEASWIMTTPANCAYIRFYTNIEGGKYNGDICINISHTGYRNGEYQPYMQFVRRIDERIKAEFPDGIRAFDKVYNKNGRGYILKGTGEVDMGSLSWEKSPEGWYQTYYTNMLSSGGAITIEHEPAKNYLLAGDMTIATSGQYIVVRDSRYATASDFKAAMSGVTLYYELAEPIIIEYNEPFNLDYEVWDFGTEEMLASEPSAPIRGLIAYGFNAVDEIRELRNMITSLQAMVTNNM